MPKKLRNRLAILVLNYNGKQYLEKCFKSLLGQTSQDFDIWLIDNDSSDGSREFTEKKFPEVHVLNTKGNLAFAGAYNFAHTFFKKQKIHYDFYYFLNNDTFSDKRMIGDILNTFNLYPDVAIVTPTIVNKAHIIDAVGGIFFFPTGTTFGYKNGQKYQRSQDTYEVFWASGCALAIRTSWFEMLKGFGDFFIYYEDLDLSWRVQNHGARIVALESTFVEHLQGGAKTATSQQLYLNERNRIWSYWRNLPEVFSWIVLPALLIARFLLLGLQTDKQVSLVFAKLRGQRDGFWNLPHQPRFPAPLRQHLKVLTQMHKAQKVLL